MSKKPLNKVQFDTGASAFASVLDLASKKVFMPGEYVPITQPMKHGYPKTMGLGPTTGASYGNDKALEPVVACALTEWMGGFKGHPLVSVGWSVLTIQADAEQAMRDFLDGVSLWRLSVMAVEIEHYVAHDTLHHTARLQMTGLLLSGRETAAPNTVSRHKDGLRLTVEALSEVLTMLQVASTKKVEVTTIQMTDLVTTPSAYGARIHFGLILRLPLLGAGKPPY